VTDNLPEDAMRSAEEHELVFGNKEDAWALWQQAKQGKEACTCRGVREEPSMARRQRVYVCKI
jgi:thiamine monophosphate kinase